MTALATAGDTSTSAEVDVLADHLCRTGRLFAERGLCPATGGNFSIRLDTKGVLITASGVDKATLGPADLLVVDIAGNPLAAGARPSAETGLHLALYQRCADIGAILHVHSVANTLLSRIDNPRELVFEGYEMQKSIQGQHTHATALTLPVLENSQDMDTLATALAPRLDDATTAHAFLVRGHGLYAWGPDLTTARRHLEGWEFLLGCELQRRKLES